MMLRNLQQWLLCAVYLLHLCFMIKTINSLINHLPVVFLRILRLRR